MDPSELLALLQGEQPGPRDRASALSGVLRKVQAEQQAKAQGQRGDSLAQLALLTGDPVLGRFGEARMQQAKEKRALERTLQAQAQAQQLEAQRNAREKAEEEARNTRDRAYQDKARGETMRNALQVADRASGVRTAEAVAKEGREAIAGISPEFELVEGARPTDQQKNKFSTGVSSANKLKDIAGQMRAALKKAGSTERLVGAKAEAINQLLTQMRLEGKGVAELGALSGPDMAIMEDLMRDPAGLRAQFMGNAESILGGVERWADSQVSGAMKAYGIRRKRKIVTGKSGKKYIEHGPNDLEEVE
jgi:hypothetical protein